VIVRTTFSCSLFIMNRFDLSCEEKQFIMNQESLELKKGGPKTSPFREFIMNQESES
jgi:hypothetical protein